jgi:hypothetical protein
MERWRKAFDLPSLRWIAECAALSCFVALKSLFNLPLCLIQSSFKGAAAHFADADALSNLP